MENTPTKKSSKDGAGARPNNSKSTLTRQASCRVIKSRFREAAAKAALDTNASGNSSSGALASSVVRSTNKENNNNNGAGSGTKPRKTVSGSNTNASVVRSLARNKMFASALSLNNSNGNNSSSNNSNTGSTNNSSSNSSSSLSRTNSFGKGNMKAKGVTTTGNSNLRNTWNSGFNKKKNEVQLLLPPPPPPPSCSASSSVASKLHSTALNATLLNTTAHTANTSVFSSTVLSQRGRVMSGSFPDLPDISAIKLDLSACSRADTASANGSGGPLSAACDVITEEEEEEECRDITCEDLDIAHLNYLTWCNLNASAAQAQEAVMQPVMKELCFLEDIVGEETDKARELREKLHMLNTVTDLQLHHDKLYPLLHTLNGSSGAWRDGVGGLAAHLEHHLHQVTVAPAVLPPTPEEIVEPLRVVTSLAHELLQMVQPCDHQLNTAAHALQDMRTLASLSEEVQEAACLALEKGSLMIS